MWVIRVAQYYVDVFGQLTLDPFYAQEFEEYWEADCMADTILNARVESRNGASE